MKKSFARPVPIILLLVIFTFVTTGCVPVRRNIKKSDPQNGTTPVYNGVKLDVPVSSQGGEVSIAVPSDWTADMGLSPDAILGASNKQKEKYVIVLSESKQDLTSGMTLNGYYDIIKQQMEGKISGSGGTKAALLTVNGYKALQFEIAGEFQNLQLKYLVTILETKGAFHQVLSWTFTDRYDGYKREFSAIARSFKELKDITPSGSNNNQSGNNSNQNTNGNYQVFYSSDNNFNLQFPNGWNQLTEQLNPDAQLSASSTAGDKYMFALVEPKSGLPAGFTLDNYKDELSGRITGDMQNTSVSDPVYVTIGGFSSVQFTIAGEYQGTKIAFLLTIIEMNDTFSQIRIWSEQDKYEGFLDEFAGISRSFRLTL